MKNNEKVKSGKALMITVSAVSVILVAGIILGISLLWPKTNSETESANAKDSALCSDTSDKKESPKVMTGEEYLASSDAVAGETSGDIKREMTPDMLSGKYVSDKADAYYIFEYAPSGAYDGTFVVASKTAGEVSSENLPPRTWKLENGEIKLFESDVNVLSLWAFEDCVVEPMAFFVGEIDPDAETQQTMLVCKDSASGAVRILNLYSDGKVVYEITNLSNVEAADDSAVSSDLNENRLLAGTYVKNSDTITVTIGGEAVDYVIVDGGLATFVFEKIVD